MNEILVKKLYGLVRALREYLFYEWELSDIGRDFDTPGYEWFMLKCTDEMFLDDMLRIVLQYCEAINEDPRWQRDWMDWNCEDALPYINIDDRSVRLPQGEVIRRIMELEFPKG